MGEVLNILNKEIKELELKKQKHIYETNKLKYVDKETEKIRKQFTSMIYEKGCNTDLICSDLDHFFVNLRDFYNKSYDHEDAMFIKYELIELLSKFISNMETEFNNITESKKGFIEALKELKKQYEE